MTVIPWSDGKGNFIFEVKSKRILIDLVKIRKLTGYFIYVFDLDRTSDLGRAYRGGRFVKLNFKKLINQKHSNSVIQRKITEALVHEVRHILQSPRRGLLEFLTKLSNGTEPLWCLLLWIILITSTGVYYFIELPVILNLTLTSVIIIISGLIFFSWIFYCFLDPYEKDARKFAREAIKNKEWLEVVKVEDL